MGVLFFIRLPTGSNGLRQVIPCGLKIANGRLKRITKVKKDVLVLRFNIFDL